MQAFRFRNLHLSPFRHSTRWLGIHPGGHCGDSGGAVDGSGGGGGAVLAVGGVVVVALRGGGVVVSAVWGGGVVESAVWGGGVVDEAGSLRLMRPGA